MLTLLRTGWVRVVASVLVLTGLGVAGALVPTVRAAPRPLGHAALAAGSAEVARAVRPVAPSSPLVALPPGRVTVTAPGGAPIHVYPPRGAGVRAPVLVMLHGMCMDPLATCEYWSEAGREGRWLVCPAGNGTCGERSDWSGGPEDRARYLDGVLDAVAQAYPGRVDRDDTVLCGFSRGAFVARDVAYARPGRYPSLVLIGAALGLDAARLASGGVSGVVMASGDLDGARSSMVRDTARLEAAGVRARFVSTGRIYHQLPAGLGDVVRDALGWLATAPSSPLARR